MLSRLFGLHCPDCGGRIREADAFCPHCGVELDAPLNLDQRLELAFDDIEAVENALEHNHDLPAALDACQRAVEIVPDSARVHILHGRVLTGLGRFHKAQQAFAKALLLEPDNSEAFHCQEKARLDETRAQLQQAEAVLEQAQSAYDLGENLVDALALCHQALEQAPNLGEAHNLRGLILEALNQPVAAILAYRQALRIDPALDDAHTNLRSAEADYADLGQHIPAGEEEPAAQQLAARVFFERSAQRLQQQDLQGAQDDCTLALRIAPSWAAAHNLQGKLYDSLGRLDKAVPAYQEAVRLEPSNEEFRQNLLDAERQYNDTGERNLP